MAHQITARRTRLAEIDRDLARLRYRHDIAMSAFRFEEAITLGPAIAALEKERQHLAAVMPDSEPPTGVAPVLARFGMTRFAVRQRLSLRDSPHGSASCATRGQVPGRSRKR